MKGDASRVVKVKPFPIEAKVQFEGGEEKGQIQKMNLSACLIALSGSRLKLQDQVTLSFELPVHKRTVTMEGAVVKIYLGATGPSATGMVEVQFRSLNPAVMQALKAFFQAIGGIPK